MDVIIFFFFIINWDLFLLEFNKSRDMCDLHMCDKPPLPLQLCPADRLLEIKY